MRNLSSLLVAPACLAAFALSAPRAHAHIDLVEPPPRYAGANKSCPCGDGDSNRTCNVTAAESTDPNRSENVSVFVPGSTITMVVEEYIDHAGRIRVAFDPDGADLSDFNDNVLLDVSDPREAGLSEDNPRVWELEVTLPNVTCDNCTLQVVQVMEVDTETPAADPATASTYYTCADITLAAQGTVLGDAGSAPAAGEGGGSGAPAPAGNEGGGVDGDDAPAAAGSTSVAPGAGGTSGSASPAPAAAGGTSMPTGPAEMPVVDASGTDDGGCALGAAPRSSSWGWALGPLALLAAGALRRRRG